MNIFLFWKNSLKKGRLDIISALFIPVWEKYTLTIEEAAAYFRIGENKLRRIIQENPDSDFILFNGNRIQIKRKKFEEYVDSLEVV